MGATLSQLFPPTPSLVEGNLPPQNNKIFLVTGGYGGMGLELTRMLYQAHATVYVAGRSPDKAEAAIRQLRAEWPDSQGRLEFLFVDLADLSGIKASVEDFRARESKLHVLWNNAGIGVPDSGSISKQGFELQLATNCLGPFLFTKLLTPTLERTMREETTPARVVWAASQTIDFLTPHGGLNPSTVHIPWKIQFMNYTTSKFGNWCMAVELARRSQGSVISVAVNPGFATTGLVHHRPLLGLLFRPIMYSPTMTAYTELYAGLSGDITSAANGCYVIPWGRIARPSDLRADLLHAVTLEQDGGSGTARRFWDFCEEATKNFQ